MFIHFQPWSPSFRGVYNSLTEEQKAVIAAIVLADVSNGDADAAFAARATMGNLLSAADQLPALTATDHDPERATEDGLVLLEHLTDVARDAVMAELNRLFR